MPNGVAAFPSPRALADIFMIMAPIAGCCGGTSGKAFTMSGRTSFAMIARRPPASATFIKPKNKAITPTRPRARVTELAAASIIPSPSCCIGALAVVFPGIQLT